MGYKKSAYELYKNGQWVLMGVSAVTAVNVLLAAFSLTLFFPFSAHLPRELVLRGQDAGGVFVQYAILGAVVLLICYLACYILSLRSDKLPAMRLGGILYALDTAVYLIAVLPDILAEGFRISHVIELVFRWFILMTLYKADKVFYDPKRKNPNAKPRELPKRETKRPEPEYEDDEDEGIQW